MNGKPRVENCSTVGYFFDDSCSFSLGVHLLPAYFYLPELFPKQCCGMECDGVGRDGEGRGKGWGGVGKAG